jgi:uncharacterized surface protein with fasciclin (FAS1) repeats
MRTIVDTALAAGTFSGFLGALRAGSFLDTLRTPGPYTVFAPTDDAFARLEPSSLRALLKNSRKLKTVLAYHVVSGAVASADLAVGELRTVEGSPLLIARDGARRTINGASVLQADIGASNGVIHVIDALLIPKTAALLAAVPWPPNPRARVVLPA